MLKKVKCLESCNKKCSEEKGLVMKTQIVTKLKKLEIWQNSNSDRTQIVTKLINLHSGNLKTQFVTKVKFWQLKHSMCDITQKLKMWQNWKTPVNTY